MRLVAYETKINCSQPTQVLQELMEDAVNNYLSWQPKVFPIDRQDMFISLKVQKSYRSSGEILTIAIDKEAFSIASRCIIQPKRSIAWGKNRDNVLALSGCVRDAIAELTHRSGRTTHFKKASFFQLLDNG